MQRLPESELDIMLALWEIEQPPVPRTYFDKKLAHKGWSANALNSFLSRLEEKGFLKSTREGKNKYYVAVVKREAYLRKEGRNILHKLYQGSIKNFMLSVTGQQGLDEVEIEELREYLDALKEGNRNER
ncbi:BlaI/MecI/CopY family transcriptional regulator [Fusibacter sp. 3D3]|uniref:BlaI/MecI/CopY family transcriptional regulator n=1 Tax=Fusibacter sp. 3D3 TaxID=1048380 RepID=UPI000853395A|nr:BlaI/MecI/CopY family transcriptional regulator [Fusibacter sp. 3D3]GAU78832.1 transcriptional repressor [Fusibacter sp. 3D3]